MTLRLQRLQINYQDGESPVEPIAVCEEMEIKYEERTSATAMAELDCGSMFCTAKSEGLQKFSRVSQEIMDEVQKMQLAEKFQQLAEHFSPKKQFPKSVVKEPETRLVNLDGKTVGLRFSLKQLKLSLDELELQVLDAYLMLEPKGEKRLVPKSGGMKEFSVSHGDFVLVRLSKLQGMNYKFKLQKLEVFVKAIQFLQIMKLADCIITILSTNELIAKLASCAPSTDLVQKQQDNRNALCSAIQKCKNAESVDYDIHGSELQFDLCELQLHLVRHGDDNDFITISLNQVSVESQQQKVHATLQQIEILDQESKEQLMDIKKLSMELISECEGTVSHIYYRVAMQQLYFYLSIRLVDQLIHYFYTDAFNVVYLVNHFAIKPPKTLGTPTLINGTIAIAEPVVDIAIIGKNDGLVQINGKSIQASQKAELVDGIPCFSMKA